MSEPLSHQYPEHAKLDRHVGNLFEHDTSAEPRPWKVKHESNYVIGPFLDWLRGKVQFAVYRRMCGRCDWLSAGDATRCENPNCQAGEQHLTTPKLWPDNRSIEDLLAEFYGVDRQKLSDEKDAMLKAIQEKP